MHTNMTRQQYGVTQTIQLDLLNRLLSSEVDCLDQQHDGCAGQWTGSRVRDFRGAIQ